MSDPKLISPLLDGFSIGKPMRGHDGSRCYPVIKENSDEKYILKMVSVPASQVQLDALLITGAYRNPADAMDYFKDVAEGVTQEAELLTTLSKLEGFLPFEGWQIVPMEDGKLGYHVCLLSPYRRSLARYMRRNPMTYLQAVNLGLDLCAALAICRRAGYLYVDLKPANIFLTKGKGYRIGDLGFVELNSLQYTSLPGKYRSSYSPPESYDDMTTLNETVDTYAVGMILYQIYNEGTLPAAHDIESGNIPSPSNADYEIGEIILKAIAQDPKARWKNPMEMGKALVGYMQRNTVNNTPIVPPSGILQEESAKPQPTSVQAAGKDSVSEEEVPVEDCNPPEAVPPLPEEVSVTEEKDDITSVDTEIPTDEPPVVTAEQVASVEIIPEIIPEVISAHQDESISTDDTIQVSLLAPKNTNSSPDLSDATKVIPIPVSVAAMGETKVFQAPVGEMSVTAENDEDEFDFNLDEFIGELNLEETSDPPESVVVISEEPVSSRRRNREEERARRNATAGWIITAILVLIFAILGYCGFLFYQNTYLVPVDNLTVTGTQNELIVTIESEQKELLSVSCTDTYGNDIHKDFVNGQATFTDLLPGSLYRIELQVSGFHKLIGKTSEIFTTSTMTNIVGLTAIAGSEDGSVLLNFTVDGTEPEEWTVICSAEGEEDVEKTFTGHSVTVKGLTTGKLYTFTLSGGETTLLTGTYSLEHIPSKLILAENLTIAELNGTSMTVRWDAPSNTIVESWTVRCYSDDGEEIIQELTETEAIFQNIDTSKGYTIEVTAAGMTQPSRTSITSDPLIITSFAASTDDSAQLTVSWEYEGNAPKDGWLLLYSVDGQDNHQSVAKCAEASAVIPLKIPEATYRFTIQAADTTTVFNGLHSYTCPSADIFSAHELSADKITALLLKTPEKEDWLYENVSKDDFTDTFAIGDNISVVLKADANFYIPEYALDVLYVIRDEDGKVLLDYVSQSKEDWKNLWYAGDYRCGELDIPKVPDYAGKFSVSIYFNGKAVTSTNFTIQE